MKKKKQEVTNSLALCSWERCEKLWFQVPKRKNKRVTSAIKKTHLRTVSKEDKHMVVLPSLSQGVVMGRGNLMDPLKFCSIYSILRLRDGQAASLDTFPKSLIRSKSSKKTNSVAILIPAHRQESKQRQKENALKVIWWTRVTQGWGFGPNVLLWFSSFS